MIFDDQGLPILEQFSEEGFVDCIFKVSGIKKYKAFYCFDLFASYNEKKVGFTVKLVSNIEPGFDTNMNLIKDHVYYHGISFGSLGKVSDDLITALAELYGQDAKALRMVQEESFTMIALQQENTNLELHQVKMKLLGRDSKPFVEDDYYESFFNVDLPNGFVSWNEKDLGYRIPLVRALSVD